MPPLNPPSELTVQEALKMGNLDELKQSFPTVKTGQKTRMSPGITVTERDESPYDPNAMNYEPDGLTPEEQGPCT